MPACPLPTALVTSSCLLLPPSPLLPVPSSEAVAWLLCQEFAATSEHAWEWLRQQQQERVGSPHALTRNMNLKPVHFPRVLWWFTHRFSGSCPFLELFYPHPTIPGTLRTCCRYFTDYCSVALSWKQLITLIDLSR